MIIHNNIKEYIEENYNVKVERMSFDTVISDNFCTYFMGSIIYFVNDKLKVMILKDITDEESIINIIDENIKEFKKSPFVIKNYLEKADLEYLHRLLKS